MFIYKITNKINQKLYIGRTKRENPFLRWNEHKSKARRRPRNVIEYAIRKYGEDNFIFEVIESGISKEEIGNRETFNILKYDSIAPKGYNLEINHPYRELCAESLLKISKSQQGLQKGTNKKKYIGTTKSRKNVYAEISFNNECYKKSFPSELKCAIFYDKLALYLYGDNAKINFEHKRNKWIKNKELFERSFKKLYKFVPKEERNIFFDKSRNRWYARARKDKKNIYIGRFKTKEEAIQARLQFLEKHKIW